MYKNNPNIPHNPNNPNIPNYLNNPKIPKDPKNPKSVGRREYTGFSLMTVSEFKISPPLIFINIQINLTSTFGGIEPRTLQLS
jgi:hypothetical protein